MVKVSIVIPVHNADQYLRQCMESVVNQTLKEIEIICVDDGSRDMSLEILESYQTKDPRIKLLKHDAARGTLVARKVSTMAAEGEYLMYIDPDDYLEPDACEILYDKITREHVDILQFNTNVVNCGNLTEEELKMLRAHLRPVPQRIDGKRIGDTAFSKGLISYNVWNKMYRTEICKKAYADIEDSFVIMAEDFYSFFYTSYYAESFLGWDSPPLYNYCIGRGVTGFSSMDLSKIEQLCMRVQLLDNIKEYCQQKGILRSYNRFLKKQRANWLEECIRLWMEKLPSNLGYQGLEIIFKYWSAEEVVSCLAETFWEQRLKVGERIQGIPHISLKDRKIKTVAFYYWTMTVGGVERVISILAPMLVERGYRVIVITDHEPTNEDFVLPESVTRVQIESWEKPWEKPGPYNISGRLKDWKRIIDTYQIDVVLYHAWISHMLLWDMLYLKTLNIPTVVHCHGGCTYPMAMAIPQFVEMHYVLPCADALVTMSLADQTYYSVYHDNVYYIPNPISESLMDVDLSDGSECSIVWVGRTSEDKQPQYIFPIMRSVIADIPGAKIYLVGDFSDKRWKEMAQEYGVTDNVIFCGKTHKVNQYYHRASVFLSTSQFEGFPMALLEAQAHGLPAVIFDLPNIMAAKPNQGVTSVAMYDTVSAASEIVTLLTDKNKWSRCSRESREFFESLLRYDVCQDWTELLEGKVRHAEVTEGVKDLCNVFVENYYQGLMYTDKRIADIYRDFGSPDGMAMSGHKGAYKVGLFVTYIPRKIWGGIRCVGENGFMYTLRLFFTKVKNKFGKVFLGWDV